MKRKPNNLFTLYEIRLALQKQCGLKIETNEFINTWRQLRHQLESLKRK